MGMTIPRNKSTKSTVCMRRHFEDLYELPRDIAVALSAYGPLAQAIAEMAVSKVKIAKTNVAGKALLDKRKAVYAKIDKKVRPVVDALAKALGDTVEVNDGFRDLVASQACKSELAEIAEIDGKLAELALSSKQDIVDKALVAIMGQPGSATGFPFADTVYTVDNPNDKQWRKLAFAFTGSNVPDAIYVEDGNGWDIVECDLSNEYVYKCFTSPRALLKFGYIYNNLPDRLAGILESVSDTYNPLLAVTPKAKADIEDFDLELWLDSWTS